MDVKQLLQAVRDGTLTVDKAAQHLQSYEDLGFAKVDLHRAKRQGFPEVIFGEGKTVQHLLAIFQRLKANNETVLATRVSKEAAQAVLSEVEEAVYHEMARCLTWKPPTAQPDTETYVAVLCAGTSDVPVAEEAAVTIETMGRQVQRIYDVGVAGIHRLLDQVESIRAASAVVVVAGMEGALASVVGGLVERPIVAVPTSVGYGSNFGGISALLTMLNSCATGVAVVNIDNGFGAGYYAAMVDQGK